MSVTVATQPRISFGLPRLLFEGRYARHYWATSSNRDYDVMPDGDHFLILRRAKSDDVRMHVAVNWLEELKRLVPADR